MYSTALSLRQFFYWYRLQITLTIMLSEVKVNFGALVKTQGEGLAQAVFPLLRPRVHQKHQPDVVVSQNTDIRDLSVVQQH
jgi:hypothetical protein